MIKSKYYEDDRFYSLKKEENETFGMRNKNFYGRKNENFLNQYKTNLYKEENSNNLNFSKFNQNGKSYYKYYDYNQNKISSSKNYQNKTYFNNQYPNNIQNSEKTNYINPMSLKSKSKNKQQNLENLFANNTSKSIEKNKKSNGKNLDENEIFNSNENENISNPLNVNNANNNYLKNPKEIFMLKDKTKFDSSIYNNVNVINGIFKGIIRDLNNKVLLSLEDVEDLSCSLSFIDTLNVFFSEKIVLDFYESIKRIFKLIYENDCKDTICIENEFKFKYALESNINDLNTVTGILKQLIYTERCIMYYKKDKFKEAIYSLIIENKHDSILDLMETSLNCIIDQKGVYDIFSFRQLKNIYWIICSLLPDYEKGKIKGKIDYLDTIQNIYKNNFPSLLHSKRIRIFNFNGLFENSIDNKEVENLEVNKDPSHGSFFNRMYIQYSNENKEVKNENKDIQKQSGLYKNEEDYNTNRNFVDNNTHKIAKDEYMINNYYNFEIGKIKNTYIGDNTTNYIPKKIKIDKLDNYYTGKYLIPSNIDKNSYHYNSYRKYNYKNELKNEFKKNYNKIGYIGNKNYKFNNYKREMDRDYYSNNNKVKSYENESKTISDNINTCNTDVKNIKSTEDNTLNNSSKEIKINIDKLFEEELFYEENKVENIENNLIICNGNNTNEYNSVKEQNKEESKNDYIEKTSDDRSISIKIRENIENLLMDTDNSARLQKSKKSNSSKHSNENLESDANNLIYVNENKISHNELVHNLINDINENFKVKDNQELNESYENEYIDEENISNEEIDEDVDDDNEEIDDNDIKSNNGSDCNDYILENSSSEDDKINDDKILYNEITLNNNIKENVNVNENDDVKITEEEQNEMLRIIQKINSRKINEDESNDKVNPQIKSRKFSDFNTLDNLGMNQNQLKSILDRLKSNDNEYTSKQLQDMNKNKDTLNKENNKNIENETKKIILDSNKIISNTNSKLFCNKNMYKNLFFTGIYTAFHKKYFALKCLEQENPQLIKANINSFEKLILMPLYIKQSNFISETKAIYTKLFKKYEKIIMKSLNNEEVIIEEIKPYGSIETNFFIDNGDLDICIVPKSDILNFSFYMEKLKEDLSYESEILKILFNRRYILLKIRDNKTKINIDITAHNNLPIYNTKLFKYYGKFDQRVHIMGLYLKNWVKVNNLVGASDNYLSSYAWLNMLVYFLQNSVEPKVLPCLQLKTNDNISSNKNESENSELFIDYDLERKYKELIEINKGFENTESASSLLVKFFEFYSYYFDYYETVIDVNLSSKIKTNNHIFNDNELKIEDPFDKFHNPGKSLNLYSPQFTKLLGCMKNEVNFILSGEYVRRFKKIRKEKY